MAESKTWVRRGGLYWKLRDKASSWEDKVKIAKYAWKYDHIHLPNKEQVLLDWLCLALAGKIRIKGKEAEPVWLCLHDVLQTKKCHNKTLNLVLKPQLSQVLLDELHHNIASDNVNTSTCDMMFGCCYSILTSPNLGFSMTAKYENMVSLIQSLLMVMSHYHKNKLPQSDKINKLFTVTVQRFLWLQRRKANAQSVMTLTVSKLLKPAIDYFHTVDEKRPQICHKDLENAIFEALLHSDLHKNYRQLLDAKLTSGSKDKSKAKLQPPRCMESFFQFITERLRESPQSNAASSHFIKMFYAKFIKFYSGSEYELVFPMAQYLCQLIRNTPPSSTSTDTTVHMMDTIFSAVVSGNVYNASEDILHGGEQLESMKELCDWLLGLDIRGDSWYNCFIHLLKLNYSVIEPKVLKILKKAWLEAPETEQKSSGLERLLCELVSVYIRLRQVHKFMEVILHGINSCQTSSKIVWPQKFIESLGTCITDLPQVTCLDIWSFLIDDFKKHEYGIESVQICSKCTLWSTLLLHMKLADYGVTKQTSDKVDTLMEQTLNHVISPLIDAAVKQKKTQSHILLLVYSWGELRLLRQQYNFQTSTPTLHNVERLLQQWDMSCIYPVTEQTWSSLWKSVEKHRDACSKYVFAMLGVQKMKYLELTRVGEADDDVVYQCSRNVTNYFLSEIKTFDPQNNALWPGQINDIDTDNYSVCMWKLILDNQWIIQRLISPEMRKNIAQFMLQTLNVKRDSNSNAGEYTFKSLSSEFISKESCSESVEMVETVVLTNSLSSVLASSPKKRKKESPRGKQSQSADLEVTKPKVQRELLNTLTTTERFPIEYINTSTQLSVLLETFTLLSSLAKSSTHTSLISTCLSVINRLLPNCGDCEQVKSRVGACLMSLYEVRCGADVDTQLDIEYKDAMFNLLRVCIKHDLAGDVNTTMEKILGNTTSSDPHTKDASFCTLCYILQITSKASLKQHLSEKHANTDINNVYSKLTEFFLSQAKQETSTGKTKHINGAVIDSITCIVTRECSKLRQVRRKTVPENDVESMEPPKGVTLPKSLESVVVKLCEYSVHSLGDLSELMPVEPITSFVCCVSRNNDILADTLPNNFFMNAWSVLMTVFRQRWVNSTNGDTKTADISQNGDDANDHASADEPMDIDCDLMPNLNRPNESICGSKQPIELALASVISVLSLAQFEDVIMGLIETLSTFPDRLVSTLHLWQLLVKQHLADDISTILASSSHKLMPQLLFAVLHLDKSEPQYSLSVLTMLNTLADMLSIPGLLNPGASMMTLHILDNIQLEYLPIDTFSSLFEAYYNVLREALLHHKLQVLNCTETYIGLAKYLMINLIERGKQTDEATSAQTEMIVVNMAQLVHRLFDAISHHKVEFGKLARYTVADYVCHVQKVTLRPSVKRALLPAVHRMLDICDDFAIAQLRTVLPHGMKDVFNTLYEDYVKYHKYKGKV